jgi:hypothetical protein
MITKPHELQPLTPEQEKVIQFAHALRTTTCRQAYDTALAYDGSRCALSVAAHSGSRPFSLFPGGFYQRVLHLNDVERKTFAEIADIVEREFVYGT